MNLRNLLRRWLGINSQQGVTSDLVEEIREVRDMAQTTEDQMDATIRRANVLRGEVELQGNLVLKTKRLLGPTWTTAEGYSAPMAFLSTPHLRNILHGGFGGDGVRAFARKEIERRTIDAEWRKREARGKSEPSKDYMKRVWNREQTGYKVGITFFPRHEEERQPQSVDYAEAERRMLANSILNAMGFKS